VVQLDWHGPKIVGLQAFYIRQMNRVNFRAVMTAP